MFTFYIVALFTTGAKYTHTHTLIGNLQLYYSWFETYQYYPCHLSTSSFPSPWSRSFVSFPLFRASLPVSFSSSLRFYLLTPWLRSVHRLFSCEKNQTPQLLVIGSRNNRQTFPFPKSYIKKNMDMWVMIIDTYLEC